MPGVRDGNTSTPSDVQQGRECELLPLLELPACLDGLENGTVETNARHAATRTEGRRALAFKRCIRLAATRNQRV
jgi:hypothetical protein